MKEVYHLLQRQRKRDHLYDDMWNEDRVIEDANKKGPFISGVKELAEEKALKEFAVAKILEMEEGDAIDQSPEFTCKVEKDAKEAVKWQLDSRMGVHVKYNLILLTDEQRENKVNL
ncbi:MAG: hypothetical protein ABIO55_10125 [Ginsengibacter sp.]